MRPPLLVSAHLWATPPTTSLASCHHRPQGYWAVYRISFATASFFFVMMLATMSPTQGSMIAHRGWWILKMLFIGAVMGGILFAPNNVLAYYAWIARFIAPIFLLYQVSWPDSRPPTPDA